MKQEKLLRRALEDNGSRVTQPRLVVFRLLQEHGLQSIAELISRSSGTVDRVSVYRVIELFEKLGIVRRVTIGWKYKLELSEIFLDHHHHITCLSCNKVVAVKEDEKLEKVIDRLADGTGFSLSSHQLELQGHCKTCRERSTTLQSS